MTKYAFIMMTSVLAAIGTAAASTCGDFKDCSSCAAEAGCMWALLYNCTELCMSTSYRDPEGLAPRNIIWRNAVIDSAECASKEECSIIAGAIKDPSFEEPYRKTWKHHGFLAIRDSSQNYESYDVPLDGNKFLLMGGYPGNKNGRDYNVRLEGVRIPRSATHLSFFYAFPFYSRVISRTNYYFFTNRTAFSIFIDGKLILHMCKDTIDAPSYISATERYYFPLNLDIKGFADDLDHALELHFVEGISKDDSNYVKRQSIAIDYVQIISSNSKKNGFLVFVTYFILFCF